ncbi:hypothetical protein [Cytobacillus oceanisediminis]|uniref:hypothetical protein n=1 Tax=Cytobacillus oceanisediminis TaxID=665099 RepID=UPI0037359890
MVNTEISSHQKYTDGIINTKIMILMSEFILDQDMEPAFVQFLNGLVDDDKWSDFEGEINFLTSEFDLKESEIEKEMKKLIKIPIVS